MDTNSLMPYLALARRSKFSPAFAPPSQFARRSEAKGIAFALQGSSLDPVAVNNAD